MVLINARVTNVFGQPEAHFTNNACIAVQIQWEFGFCVSPLYHFATCHDNTHVVACAKFHGNHFTKTWMLYKFAVEIESRWKIVRETGHSHYSVTKCGIIVYCVKFKLPDTFVTHHDDVIKWKHFPRYWPFVRGIHRSPVNSPDKGQWCGALMFSLICAWINAWVNNREAGDLTRYCAQCDVIVMQSPYCKDIRKAAIIWISTEA